tara:strand:- start:69 stop:1694 length:1626 start_codon:yes stop_codon:yes gene_type:complete
METKKKPVRGFKTNSNFFANGGRHIGFEGLSTIFELVDNSIDAEANQIEIKYTEDTKTKLKTIIVSDNGSGFTSGSLLDSVQTWGSTRLYDNAQIGNFGVGMSATVNEVVQDGGVVTIETSDGNGTLERLVVSKETPSEDKDLDSKSIITQESRILFDPSSSPYFGESFTTIKLDGVRTKLTTQHIVKNTKVVYYPNYVRLDGNFSISVKNGKGPKKEIRFIDPLYRDLSHDKCIKSYDTKFKFEGHSIEIKAKALLPMFPTEFQDRIKEDLYDYKDKPVLPPNNGGLYLRYGGRYISIGDKIHPGRQQGGINMYSGLRFELELPKHVTNFPINVNKSKILFDENDTKLENFMQEMVRIRRWYKGLYDKCRGPATTNQSFIDAVNKRLASLIGKGRLKDLLGYDEDYQGTITRRPHTRDNTKEGVKEKNTGITRHGRKVGSRLAVDFYSGSKRDAWFYVENKDKQSLVIMYNENAKLTKESKRLGEVYFSHLSFINYCNAYANQMIVKGYENPEHAEQTREDFEETIEKATEISNKTLGSD